MVRYIGCAAVLVALVLTPVSMAAPVDLGVVRDAVDFLRTRHYNPQLDMLAIIRAGVPGLRRALERAGVPAKGLADIPRGTDDQALSALEVRLTEAVRLAGGRVSEQDLIHAAIRAMFRAVGDRTVFLTPGEREVTQAFNQGRIGAVGVRLLELKGRWIITGVAPGGPAAQAGLQRGDELVRIGGEEARGLTLAEMRVRLFGEPGSSVNVTVRRGGRTMTVPLTRAIVSFPIVEHRMLPDRVAYVRVFSFLPDGAYQIRTAVTALAAERPRGLIVDLREAGEDAGRQYVDAMSIFFPTDTVVAQIVTRDPAPALRKTWGSPALAGLPTAVLAGQGTWGAGELAAAALKEHAGARLVGQRTSGEVSVFVTSTLRDGSLAVVVEGHILSGKGLRLHGRGLKPDVEVAEDRALERAIQAVTQKR